MVATYRTVGRCKEGEIGEGSRQGGVFWGRPWRTHAMPRRIDLQPNRTQSTEQLGLDLGSAGGFDDRRERAEEGRHVDLLVHPGAPAEVEIVQARASMLQSFRSTVFGSGEGIEKQQHVVRFRKIQKSDPSDAIGSACAAAAAIRVGAPSPPSTGHIAHQWLVAISLPKSAPPEENWGIPSHRFSHLHPQVRVEKAPVWQARPPPTLRTARSIARSCGPCDPS